MIGKQQRSLLRQARVQGIAGTGIALAVIVGTGALVMKVLKIKKPDLVMQFLKS